MATTAEDRIQFKDEWEKILTFLRSTMKKSEFLTWFGQTALLENKEGTLVVGVPSEFFMAALSTRKEQILDAAQHVETATFPVRDIEIIVDGTIHKQDERIIQVERLDKNFEKQQAGTNTVTLVEGLTSKLLNPRYSLDNFIVGPSNQLAYAAAQAVSQKPGEAYNPLFIYGDVGLGKTHLLQAIGNAIHRRDKKKVVVYSTSERFVNEVVEAIQKRQTAQLKKKYRDIDVLIIDDIQFLAHKDQTQIEFFHTFNVLYEARKQIILSSDRPPKELMLLEPRLRSRFESGMIVDVQMADYETRLAILRAKCQERGFMMDPELLEFIAHNTTSSIRELEGILNQAIAQYELVRKTPTIQSIGLLLQKLNRNVDLGKYADTSKKVSIQTEDEVIEIISKYYKLPTEDVIGNCRKKEIAVPRQIAMYFCKIELGRTYERIGELFNGRLHSTVMHAVSKIQTEMKKDGKLARDINALREEMGFL